MERRGEKGKEAQKQGRVPGVGLAEISDRGKEGISKFWENQWLLDTEPKKKATGV